MAAKPKVFIGSSREAKHIADAIHAGLQRDAECTVWTNQVFGISDSTLSSLMSASHQSDFGIFVFAPDDVIEARGKLFSVARDNVVYELGLFSGALAPERCFFVIPQTQPVHLPSDLAGITAGIYEDDRQDKNWRAAVNTFCDEARGKIRELGLRSKRFPIQLHELSAQYEVSDTWIADLPERVRRKDEIFDRMRHVLNTHSVSKHELITENRPGFRAALAAAIFERPAETDVQLLLDLDPLTLPRGNVQHKMLDAAILLVKRFNVRATDRERLAAWASQMPSPDPSLPPRIEHLRR